MGGADCSLRTCPTAGAWAASASAKNDHVSNKVECAARGKCDRSSGECTCEEGFAGSACQRSSCPNACNGHGTCQSIAQIADDFSHNADDAQRAQGCKCDAGYRGPDCSLKECPSGDD